MEEKDVQRLLDMLYGMIDEAKGAAFSSEKCIINREEALDLLEVQVMLLFLAVIQNVAQLVELCAAAKH